MSRAPIVHAEARPDAALNIWIVSYNCATCRRRHHYSGGPLEQPPTEGPRTTPCGRDIVITATLNRADARPMRTPTAMTHRLGELYGLAHRIAYVADVGFDSDDADVRTDALDYIAALAEKMIDDLYLFGMHMHKIGTTFVPPEQQQDEQQHDQQ